MNSIIPVPDLRAQCEACGLYAPDAALAPLAVYLELLMRWNAHINLVGTRSWQETLRRLVADSFYVADMLKAVSLPPEPVTWDLGAGAGLPGLPLRMLWQDGTYTLIEVREKRALFLQTALARLHLPRTRVFHGRVEDYVARHSPADLIISRACMPWPQLMQLVAPYIHDNGYLLCMTRTPPEIVPAPWHCVQAKEYTVSCTTRWLWLCRPDG